MNHFSFLYKWQCLGVRYRTSRLIVYGSGTGPGDSESRGPVPDHETTLRGLSRGPGVNSIVLYSRNILINFTVF